MEEQTCLIFKNQNHLVDLNNMRLSGKLCDVTIIVNNKKFLAHKNILAANIKYFESMFLSPFQESKQDIITLQGVDEKIFKAFLTFAYTGEILLTDANTLALLKVANYFNEDSIEKACINFLEKHMKKEDALQAYELASSVDCLSLKNIAKKNILTNFESCSQSTDYLNLDCESLKDILSDISLYFVNSPEIFFDGVMKWIVHNSNIRRDYIDTLLNIINITKLNTDYLFKYCCRNIEDYGDVVKDIMTTYNKYKQIENQTEQVMIIGIIDLDLRMQLFDFTEKKWSQPYTIHSFFNPSAKRGLLLSNKFYYIQEYYGQYIASLKVFDLTTGENKILNCENVLCFSCMCTFGRYLYLCGRLRNAISENVGSKSDQIIRYNLLTNTFENFASMKTARSSTAIIYHEGCLYIFGGYDQNDTMLHSVEKYEIDTKTWIDFPSMCKARVMFAVVVLDEKLYVCGGLQESSVEVYDPFENRWQLVASMNKQRCNFVVIVHERKFLAIGGDADKSVEVYDPLKDEWHIDLELSSGLLIEHTNGGLTTFIHTKPTLK